MKNRLWWVLCVSVLCARPCAAEPTDSHITAVTVFQDRADVTRAASLKLATGAQTLELSALPSAVEPASVTAKGRGEAEVVIYGVRVITRQLETAQDPKVKAIEEEMRDIKRHQQEISNTKRALQQERKYLDSIQAASAEQIGKDLITKSPSAADAASMLAFLDEALVKNFERDQQADIALEELSRKLDQLQRELADLTQGRYKQETAILVDLDAREGGSFLLEVSYRVPGASWQPTYEARASSGADAVEFVTSALVRQHTGEDWPDVRLTLSTARPAMAGSMPELQPWFLRPWEPRVAKNASLMVAEAPASRADEFALNEEENKPARGGMLSQEAALASAQVEAQGPSVTFTLPRAESIPGDWQPHKVPIGSQRFQASLAYETTPRLMPYAFLRAKVTNTTETLYLAGPVSVFLDGAFVSTAALKQVAPGEPFDLYLGIDERVKVERKQLKEHVEVSLLPGLRGKTKSTDYAFLTTLENFTGRKIAVTVFEQVPVSDRGEIIVESMTQDPAQIENEKEKPGVFRWLVELGPTQQQELRLSYRVRHPVDMRVQ